MKTLNNQPLYFLIILVVTLLFGCRPQRSILPEPYKILDPPAVALSAIHSNHARFESFAARFTGTAVWQGTPHTISGSIRILHDRAIWISVAPVMGIEISRVVVTPDSVRFLNRMDGTYFTGDIRYLNRIIGSNMDFFMLQAVLLGNDFAHFSSHNVELEPDRDLLRLNFPQRHRINPSEEDFWIKQSVWMDQKTYRLMQTNLTLPQYAQQINVKYLTIENIEGQQLPVKMHISIAGETSAMELTLSLSRVQLNTPIDLSFSIPPRYRKIEM